MDRSTKHVFLLLLLVVCCDLQSTVRNGLLIIAVERFIEWIFVESTTVCNAFIFYKSTPPICVSIITHALTENGQLKCIWITSTQTNRQHHIAALQSRRRTRLPCENNTCPLFIQPLCGRHIHSRLPRRTALHHRRQDTPIRSHRMPHTTRACTHPISAHAHGELSHNQYNTIWLCVCVFCILFSLVTPPKCVIVQRAPHLIQIIFCIHA